MATQNKIIEMIGAIKTIYPYYAKETDVQTLVKTWTLLLKDYPDDVVQVAFYKCLQVCKMPPTPADVIERIESLMSANEPTDEELWNEFTNALRKTRAEVYYIQYPKYGQDHRQNIQDIWDKLPEKIKVYVGGKGELIRMARDCDDDEIKFEKTRFLKTMPQVKTRTEYVALLTKVNNLMLEG